MPSGIFRVSQTGVSTTVGFSAVYFPDLAPNVFSLGISCVVASTALTYSVQQSYDYPGPNSSTWVSTAATWFTTTGFSSVAGVNSNGSLFDPVTAIRLHVTTGTTAASTASITMTIVQTG